VRIPFIDPRLKPVPDFHQDKPIERPGLGRRLVLVKTGKGGRLNVSLQREDFKSEPKEARD